MIEVTVVEMGPQTVVGMRKRGRYQEIPTMIAAVCQFVMSKGIQFLGPPVFVCHEVSAEAVAKADSEGSADVEVAVPVSAKVEGSGDVECYELPGGTMAKTIHKGPYEECESTYEKLFAWIAQSGKTVAGPIREVYLNDPNQVSPEEIMTEIYAPIE
jgi:AraC family transcriptional regulator